MVLQTSGTISLSDIQGEFLGDNPISISEYYRGGTYVPEAAINANIPTSGTISLSDFYGTSRAVDLQAKLVGGGGGGGAGRPIDNNYAQGFNSANLGQTSSTTIIKADGNNEGLTGSGGNRGSIKHS